MSCLSARVQFGERVGIGGNGLLQQAVEKHAACAGVSAVEAEGVFVEVVGQQLVADGVLQRAGQPAFEQRRDQVHSGQDLVQIRVAGLGEEVVGRDVAVRVAAV